MVLYVCALFYIHTHTQTHTRIYIHIYTHIHISTHTHTSTLQTQKIVVRRHLLCRILCKQPGEALWTQTVGLKFIPHPHPMDHKIGRTIMLISSSLSADDDDGGGGGACNPDAPLPAPLVAHQPPPTRPPPIQAPRGAAAAAPAHSPHFTLPRRAAAASAAATTGTSSSRRPILTDWLTRAQTSRQRLGAEPARDEPRPSPAQLPPSNPAPSFPPRPLSPHPTPFPSREGRGKRGKRISQSRLSVGTQTHPLKPRPTFSPEEGPREAVSGGGRRKREPLSRAVSGACANAGARGALKWRRCSRAP